MSQALRTVTALLPSRPARGGWIEINSWSIVMECQAGPAPHGAGGLKCLTVTANTKILGTPPTRYLYFTLI